MKWSIYRIEGTQLTLRIIDYNEEHTLTNNLKVFGVYKILGREEG